MQKSLVQRLIADYLPHKCLICERICSDLVCALCRASLPLMPNHCYSCSALLSNSSKYCGKCLTAPSVIDSFAAVFAYQGKVRELVLQAKFASDRRALEFLARELAALGDKLVFAPQTCLLPLPVSRRRLQERSYNQTHFLADFCSKSWQIPCYKHLLRREHRLAQSQTRSRKERERNLRNAFFLAADAQALLRGKNIVLIDDVWTTGSSCKEAAKLLRRQLQIASIGALVVAATLI